MDYETWLEIKKPLRKILSHLYTDEADILRVLRDAGFRPMKVKKEKKVINWWDSILEEGEKEKEKIDQLLTVALGDYSFNPELIQVKQKWDLHFQSEKHINLSKESSPCFENSNRINVTLNKVEEDEILDLRLLDELIKIFEIKTIKREDIKNANDDLFKIQKLVPTKKINPGIYTNLISIFDGTRKSINTFRIDCQKKDLDIQKFEELRDLILKSLKKIRLLINKE